MCGICGILRLGDAGEPPTLRLIEAVTQTLGHRGPDDSGVWSDHHTGLGHRRLSVVDLSQAGHQSMANEDGSVRISYNGEVYNFRERNQRYALAQPHRRTALARHATELNGVFAFALRDARRQELHLARDRFGIKPLFYQRDGETFRFASKTKAILADPALPRRPEH